MNNYRILLIEDDPVDVESVTRMLCRPRSVRANEPSFEVVPTGSLSEAVEALGSQGPFDIALLDLGLPDGEALESVGQIRRKSPELALVVLSGREDEELAIQAVRLGAQDYLVKGVLHPKMLIRVLRYAVQRKLTEKELEQKTIELQRSNSDLEQFAYIASHDLKEPLRMISSYTKLLAKRYKGRLDSDADEFIRYAVEGANRMERLIEDLLAYSRVSTRSKPVQPVDSESCFQEVVDSLRMAIEDSGAIVTHDPLPMVMSDPTQLGQVFQNLIGNGIKFRGSEDPRIHVTATRNDDEWRFCVSDNGIGLDPEFTPRIFEIFQRLHGGEKYPGTGIGLAICKRTVERHGGRIWAESRGEKGSKFYFTLPFVTEDVAENHAYSKTEKAH